MSKLRVIIADLEGDSATLLAAIDSVLSRTAGDAAVARELPPAPVAPAALPAPLRTLPASTAARKGGKVARVAQEAPKAAAPPKAAPLRQPRSAPHTDAAPARVLELLAKRPMTSGELIKTLVDSSAPAIYSALSQFRAQGKVTTWEDPADGQRKNKLVA